MLDGQVVESNRKETQEILKMVAKGKRVFIVAAQFPGTEEEQREIERKMMESGEGDNQPIQGTLISDRASSAEILGILDMTIEKVFSEISPKLRMKFMLAIMRHVNDDMEEVFEGILKGLRK